MSHGLQFDNPVDANRAAQERLTQLKEFYHSHNLSMTDFRYEYEIFTNVRSNEIEDSQDVVCLQWQKSGYDLDNFIRRHNIPNKLILWSSVPDIHYPHATTNECLVFGEKVKPGQYICYNKKTK